ncbi:MAG: TRAP transporter large permease [Deltaproteobacteria bacterium]|nr:TRAP transporter large permease [Deltaproteobacteria bacterium]
MPMVLVIFLIAVLGAPLFIIFGAIALEAFHQVDIPSSAIVIEMSRLVSAPTLSAIPLFTFAGYLMAESGTPKRLVNLSKALFGWLPGGLAIVSLIACAFFTAFTGASGVTIIALGGLLYPILIKESYGEDFTTGLMTTGGSLGLLFPPSLPIILYGLVAGVSVNQLFAAGIFPGFLIMVILGAYALRQSFKAKKEQASLALQTPAESEEEKITLGKALYEAALEIPLPFIILIGIYGGYFTASEAAAITALYVLIVEVFLYRDVSFFKDLPRIIKESMVLVGSIIVILAVAMGFTSYLVDEQIPNKIFDWIQGFITNKWAFLIALNIFLLIVGSLMDIFSAIIVVVPIILPIAARFGIHPVHLAMIFLTNLEIGYITPPVGINLFISSIRFKKSITHLYKVSLPFLFLLLIALMVITYWSDLSLFLVEYWGVK